MATKKQEKKVKLSPPWDGHMSMLASFFKGDPRVKVGYVKDGVGTIEVLDSEMYNALCHVLRTKIRFGNVRFEVRLVPANGLKAKEKELTPLAALKIALKKNPAFDRIRADKSNPMEFVNVIFKPVVLQWYNDNLGNPWKLTTGLHEFEADRVFKDELGVVWTTGPQKEAK